MRRTDPSTTRPMSKEGSLGDISRSDAMSGSQEIVQRSDNSDSGSMHLPESDSRGNLSDSAGKSGEEDTAARPISDSESAR
jgi:hypothetical protein